MCVADFSRCAVIGGVPTCSLRLWLMFVVYQPKLLHDLHETVQQQYPADEGGVAAAGGVGIAGTQPRPPRSRVVFEGDKPKLVPQASALRLTVPLAQPPQPQDVTALGLAPRHTLSQLYWHTKAAQQPWSPRAVPQSPNLANMMGWQGAAISTGLAPHQPGHGRSHTARPRARGRRVVASGSAEQRPTTTFPRPRGDTQRQLNVKVFVTEVDGQAPQREPDADSGSDAGAALGLEGLVDEVVDEVDSPQHRSTTARGGQQQSPGDGQVAGSAASSTASLFSKPAASSRPRIPSLRLDCKCEWIKVCVRVCTHRCCVVIRHSHELQQPRG